MKKSLKKYITLSEPFGPRDAALIDSSDHEVSRLLFDPKNKIFNEIESNPSIIFGRKGSGKTSYLKSAYFQNDFEVVDELKSPGSFSEVIKTINQTGGSFYFSEEVAELWEKLFQVAVLPKIVKSFNSPTKEIDLINDFLGKHGYKGAAGAQKFLWNILLSVRANAANGSIASTATKVVTDITGADFDDIKDAAIKILQENKSKVILLVDSYEHYPTEIDKFEHATAGLLRCVGAFNKTHDFLNIRVALPSELYHYFSKISSAPLKDFNYTIVLHWHSQELLSIVAHRLRYYLDLYYPDLNEEIEPASKESTLNLLKKYLPETVKNGLGVNENTVAYILRHTQLLPRHLIMFLNSIFELSRKHDSNHPFVSEKSVLDGIRKAEGNLTVEIINAYKQIYPTLGDVCSSCINEIPLSFTSGDLQKIYNRHGKKSSGFDSFNTFKEMLIETGVIGLVINETDKYFEGRFEYTMPHRLVTSSTDKLCIHPVFAEVYRFKKTSSAVKTVYPYGTDPDTEDYRE